MRSVLKQVASALLGLLLIALALALALWGLQATLRTLLDGVDPTVGAALITVLGTVSVSLLSVGLARRYELRKDQEQRIRAAKVPIYSDLIGVMFRIMDASAKGTDPEAITTEVTSEMRRITAGLVTWASPNVIQSWSNFRRGAEEAKWTGLDAAFALEKVLIAIRQDIGHSVRDLQSGDLLALFLNGLRAPQER